MFKSPKKILMNLLKHYNLIAIEQNTVAKDEIDVHCKFNGKIVSGNNMTINQLADIVQKGFTDLKTEVAEIKTEVVEIKQRLDLVEKRLDEHTAIFKRNNLK